MTPVQTVVPLPCSATDARSLSLERIVPADPSAPRAEQARSVFERMETALASAGLDFTNVVRTWFHLDDILGWYDEFNRVRTAFFEEQGVFGGVVPASTGVGIAPPAGAALVGSLLAVRPYGDGVRIAAVPSPLQCPAIDYRSAFSRAVEVDEPGGRHLYVSGTASIAPDGTSVRRGDVGAQIRLTLDVVEAILKSRGMSWRDTTRAIAYFRVPSDVQRLAAEASRRELPPLPWDVVRATICRDELLFELELDAETSRG